MKTKIKKRSSNPEKLNTPDVRKMLRIMKKYHLKQIDVAFLLSIHHTTVHGWLHASKNATGNIASKYFDELKKDGYV